MSVNGADERLFFRQLLAGRDFAIGDQIARQMVNFVYLIGDRERGECVAVDPAYGVHELVDLIGAEGLRLTGVLATHWHADHVGGDLMGYPIEGIRDLVGRADVTAPPTTTSSRVPTAAAPCGSRRTGRRAPGARR